MTFLFVGRLVPFKCVDVAISAFRDSALLRRHRLVIVGDGPERAALERQVAEADLAECVQFIGSLPQTEAAQWMQQAHVFAFPSIRDSGASVVVEAMMSGLATVAIDYGPTHHWLTEETGIRVPLGDRAAHVRGFRAAMERLAADPVSCRAMGGQARDRALALFTWQAKARKIVQVYEWVLGRRPAKPDFFSVDAD